MRFIGNKEKLLGSIEEIVNQTGITSGTFFDFFSGTSTVGKFFKKRGYSIISSDILYFSYVLQRAYIKNNNEPRFTTLLKHINPPKKALFESPLEQVQEFLNSLSGVNGFIYKNYTEEGTKNNAFIRKYFSAINGKKIDSIRSQIEQWKDSKIINENEYYILLANLIESVSFYANISGVYGAFLKEYDPRSLKPLLLKPVSLVKSKAIHKVYYGDSMNLLNKITTDILYLDPPYNERQYAPNYHLLETIAKYDSPSIKGMTGMREYHDQKSDFCNKNKGIIALEKIISTAKFKCLLLSYNSEGIMPKKKIIATLKKYGKVSVKNINYLRYKSNSKSSAKAKKHIEEQIYLLTT